MKNLNKNTDSYKRNMVDEHFNGKDRYKNGFKYF